MNNNMDKLPIVLVLAGGKGSRLRKLVSDRPKVLADINGKPYIKYLMEWLHKQGALQVHLSLGHQAEQVIEWLQQAKLSGLDISWHVETQSRGTGGAIVDAINDLEKRGNLTELLVCNGDTFVDFDLSEFVQKSKCCGGMLTTKVPNASRFGAVSKSGDLLSSFKEKQVLEMAGEINAGWYFLEKTHLESLKNRDIFSFEREYLMDPLRPPIKCVNEGHNFLDFGTPESYLQAQYIFKE
tara:strand:+ start:4321 stop:5037 length:717 start_codon:yes stop_codon:yes gene_type:complete